MARLRKFMFERVYLGEAARARAAARRPASIEALLDHYLAAPGHRAAFAPEAAARTRSRGSTDYLAGMTDRFCIREFERLTVPRALET